MTTVPQLEQNRTIFTTGLIPSSNLALAGDSGSVEALESVLKGTKLEFLAQSHPFTRQLDIVLPSPPSASPDATVTRLSNLKTRYGRTTIGIGDISDPDADAEGGFVNEFVKVSGFEAKSAIQVLSITPQNNQNATTSQTTPTVTTAEDDCWCIDSRAILTLSATKATYETLGIVGKKLPFKGHHDRRVLAGKPVPVRESPAWWLNTVIQFSLQNRKGADANREKRRKAFKEWDERRKREGKGLWEVLFCFTDAGDDEHRMLQGLGANGAEIKTVKCQVATLQDVHIPIVDLKPLPADAGKDEKDDWYDRIANMYEWIGLAGLGAQRLKVNDRVDSYVASYDPPEPSQIGNVDCLRWRGLLGPGFVQQAIKRTISSLRNSDIVFANITSSSFTSSPVSYIPAVPKSGNGKKEDISSMKIPSSAGEDTWSLILSNAPDGVRWVMVESVGPRNTR